MNDAPDAFWRKVGFALDAAGQDDGSARIEHVPDADLQKFAEGRAGYLHSAINGHLMRCDKCTGTMLDFETAYLSKLKRIDIEPVQFALPAVAALAGLDRRHRSSPDRLQYAQPLIYTRMFQVDLARFDQDVFIVVYTDDPADIENVSVRSIPSEEALKILASVEDDVLRIAIGPAAALTGSEIALSFSYDNEEWLRRVKFIDASE